ncbi:mediator complex, subunit Med20 [Sphaerosporella brunnea]|uniref:Mediator of RNA polymerase II transcription subunit 20 n=1 Tax=Sphaerosporella brunnea TaxID=1250544 RepID=A0A5J5EYC6_9PEZI|nr:mediator complex, subunit Med20 [Sphaerosporella brunnea]
MPVTGLYFIAETPSPTSTPIYNSVLDRLQKRHQPVHSGHYRLDHRLHRNTLPETASAPSFLQYLELPHLSPLPFVLCGTALITLERDFLHVLKSKLGGVWTHRQQLRADGVGCDIEDFRVRVGRLFMGEQNKGVVLEVEYLPVDTIAAGEPVLRDFVDGLELPWAGKWFFGSGDRGKEWTVMDTGRAYCEMLRFR